MFNYTKYFKGIGRDSWTLIFVVFIAGYTIFNLAHWRSQSRIFHEDVINYYGYLPATFIYGDVTLQEPNPEFKDVEHMVWYKETPDGDKVFKSSMGMAVVYAPFFFVAHWWTVVSGGDANGYSPPYKFGICMSSLVALLIGLLFLRKVLREFFDARVTALTLLLVGLGTNLYFYTVLGIGMPHLYLFALLSAELYLLSRWYKEPTLKRSVLIGLLGGLMILIRPTMVVIVVVALLFKVYNRASLKSRIAFYLTNYRALLLVVFAAFVVWIPQFLYWKAATGSFIFYSYTDEGFFFSDPQLLNILFGFRKGWLIYTPVMIFGLIGLIMMGKAKQQMTFTILVPVVIYMYVASSWWCWWFGGSFGYRPMIDLYPLMAIGLAYFIQYLFTRKVILRRTLLAVISLTLCLNLFQTRQAHEGLLHHDSMTGAAYFELFGKLKPTVTKEEIAPLLNPPDYDAAKAGIR